MKQYLYLFCLLFILNISKVFGDFSFGVDIPLITNKVYFGPYIQIGGKTVDFCFNMGLNYTREENIAINKKQWLGYYLNIDFLLNLMHKDNFILKSGIGYSFHHLAHIDRSLKYHIMPFIVKFEYITPTKVKIFYKFQYPLIHSSDIEFEDSFINSVGIGIAF